MELKQKLEELGEIVFFYSEKIHPQMEMLENIDFIISYGYRHIIKQNIIDTFNQKIINLHISYLPWNKGADPNLWSFLDDTPKGVSIHYVDQGLDTGDILLQKRMEFNLSETLSSTYHKLSTEIEELLISNWVDIKMGRIIGRVQSKTEGSFHYKKDKQAFEHLLEDGYDTCIAQILGKAKRGGNSWI